MKTPIVLSSADEFKSLRESWVYDFPMPKRGQFGGVLAQIEPIYKRGKITSLLVSILPTEDKRYLGKVFEIRTPASDMLCTFEDGITNCLSFFSRIARIFYCKDHRTSVLAAYVPPEAKFLQIGALTTMATVCFKTGKVDD